jgi:hypothetical protein
MTVLILLTLTKLLFDIRLLQLCEGYTPKVYPIVTPLSKDSAG